MLKYPIKVVDVREDDDFYTKKLVGGGGRVTQ